MTAPPQTSIQDSSSPKPLWTVAKVIPVIGFALKGKIMTSAEILPLLRDLYSKHPEMRDLESWELQSALFVLGYTDELKDEAQITVAVEVTRSDFNPDEAVA